jgi:hypothetical protein
MEMLADRKIGWRPVRTMKVLMTATTTRCVDSSLHVSHE